MSTIFRRLRLWMTQRYHRLLYAELEVAEQPDAEIWPRTRRWER